MFESIHGIKQYLEENLGQELTVTVQMGRRKQKERKGVLQETYGSVFVVALDQDENDFQRVSYSYRDILTDTIQLEFK